MTIKLARVIGFHGDGGMQSHFGKRGSNELIASANMRVHF
jgi:hypothetical protein